MGKINLESTKNCKIISTLQTVFKSKYDEVGRGYPEAVVDEIIKISQIESFKDLNVVVVDDYNLEMTSKLTKLGAKVSLICSSKRFEKLAKNIYKESVFEHILYYEDIGNLNMKFDLIIANPPYGLNNSTAKRILENLLTDAIIIALVPKNTFKKESLWSKVANYKSVDGSVFSGAVVQNLMIAVLNNSIKNEVSFESININEKQKEMVEAINEYNSTHLAFYTDINVGGYVTTEQLTAKLGKKAKHPIPDFMKNLSDVSIEDVLNQRNCFITTVWTPLDGIHFEDAEDRSYNIYKKSWKEWKRFPCNTIFVFKDVLDASNFTKWWYSCTEKSTGKKRIGLTNFCLDLIRDINSKSSTKYFEYLPHVDWSRPWTDEEILEEIGLPKDFLRDYNNK